MSNQLIQLSNQLATQFNLGDGSQLLDTLKKTAFKSNATDEQMTALLIVANQYKLNPWTKEIYAFPDRSNGIVPIVGVDGWSRIINSYPEFDGMEFDQDDESCTCKIYRKDRTHPISVTEWMAECKRDNAQPWKTHPKRMLRHKAMIQCARLAFGFVGIYDQDEAERINEATQIKAVDGDESNPQYESLLNKLTKAAEMGKKLFGDTWATLTKEERQIVGIKKFETLKSFAKDVDDNTVEQQNGTENR
ncbi:phage recombination protein Bet [Neisseria sp. Ec49-e6-T10]|uniref:phage recombination protein Bet n=1 Tax=Neisseria sp. Ec49-e6-T10 TaxID=3140744 RepID=UPI003EBC56ED